MNQRKIVLCPNCNTDLVCWTYMVNATINCDKCQNHFQLTEKIWNSSYDRFNHDCSNCNKNTTMNVLKHSENELLIQCVSCQGKVSIPLKKFKPIDVNNVKIKI